MNIQSLTVSAFGKLKDTTVRLSPGINIVSGSNESGKSTFARFIRFMLYGAGRNTADSDKRRYMPFDGDTLKGSMVIEEGGNTNTLRREAGTRNTFSAFDENGDAVFTDGLPGLSLFGVGAEVFDRTAMISAGDVAFKDASSLCAAIQNTVFSADSAVDTSEAVEKLGAYRKALLGKTGKSGRLYEARTEYAALCDRRTQSLSQHETIRALEASHAAASAKLDENRAVLRGLQSELDAIDAKKAADLMKELRSAKDALVSAEKERDDKRTAMTLDGFFPNKAFLSELAADVNTVCRCDERLAAARREFEGAEEALRGVFHDARQIKFNETLKARGQCAEDVSFALTKLCEETNRLSKRMILFFCMIITFPLGIAALLARKKKAEEIAALCDTYECKDETELAALLRGSRRADEILHAAKKRCAAAKDALDKALGERYEAANELTFRLDRSGRHVGDTSDVVGAANEQIRALEREIGAFDALLNEVSVAGARYEALCAAAGNMEQLAQKAAKHDPNAALRDEAAVKRENDFYSKATESLTTRERDLERRLTEARANAEDLGVLSEKITALEAEIHKLETQNAALTLAEETLKGAAEEVRRSISPLLTKRAAKYFASVTNDENKGLFIKDDMTLSFTEDGDGIRHEASFLSTGTLDAAYICARLSLVETVFDAKPVILFDDAFSHLDDGRLNGICRLLETLSEEYQIILMTCHSREEKALEGKANVIRF